MSQRKLSAARMDYTRDTDLPAFRDQVLRLRERGIAVEASLQISYQWRHDCSADLAAVEQDAQAQTLVLLDRIADVVHDFELLNEVSLRADTRAEVPPYKGSPATTYKGKACYATLAAVLRGMSRAIVERRTAGALPLRIILGAVANDFGFLEFMQQQGVVFDIVGYHAYPWATQALLSEDSWYGPGGALAQLARFNRPVRINEFNCGEIYAPGYENRADLPVTIACLTGIRKHLAGLLAQQTVELQSIHVYELTDRPTQPVPENRFGLMYDLDTPKLHLALYALFAGGQLSDAERLALQALGLLPPIGATLEALRGR